MLIVITCYKTNYVVIVYLTSSLISATDVKFISLYYNSNLTVVRSKRKYACLTINKIHFVVDLSYVRSPLALGDTLENSTDYIYKIWQNFVILSQFLCLISTYVHIQKTILCLMSQIIPCVYKQWEHFSLLKRTYRGLFLTWTSVCLFSGWRFLQFVCFGELTTITSNCFWTL